MSIKGRLLSFNIQNNALEEVRVLANTVNCHARTLVSLANEIKTTEVTSASQNIRGTILKLERIYSIRKNKSFFSSVRKSIEKINHADIKHIKSLAIFHSHADIKIMQKILGVDDKKIRKIINEMIRTGLAEEIIEHDYLRFDPILPIYMGFSITSKQKELYRNRLINLMDEKIKNLYDLYQNNSLKYENLIKMEMPNLLMLLNTLSERLKNNQCHVDFFTRYLINIELLMRDIGGYQHKYDEIVKLCNQALEAYKVWGAVTFILEKIKVDSLLHSGQIEESLNKANALIKKCEMAGKHAYSGAEYDIALAYATTGRVYDVYGKTRDALPYLEKAQESFDSMNEKGLFMAFLLLGEQAGCWKNEGNFNKAEEIYKKILENEKYKSIPKNLLSISKYSRAINNVKRKEFDAAISDLKYAIDFFKETQDINRLHQSLAGVGHAYREMALNSKEEAVYYMRKSEHYYMQALAIYDSTKNPKHEADTFIEMGNLYSAWNRQEHAAKLHQMAANIFFRLNDLREEGIARSNLANALIQVGHYEQAHEELKRSLVCKEPFNGSVEPWITWNLLSHVEKVKGNILAAKDNYQKALSMFLSYRRIGGEHPSKIDALCRFAFNKLNQEEALKAVEFINNLSMQNDWQEYKNFLEKLQAILAGERSLALAENEDLRYDLAAELILLLEELQEAGI